MPNQKSLLYRHAQNVARTLHIPPPRWNGSTISSLQSYIRRNQRRNLPFLNQLIRTTNRLPYLSQLPQYDIQQRRLRDGTRTVSLPTI